MPYFEYEDKRILFVHIPKTGGTTIEKWLQNLSPIRCFNLKAPPSLKCSPQHLTYEDLNAIFGEDYFDYCFTIVRNPYERLASEYRWRVQKNKQAGNAPLPAFSTWVSENIATYEANQWILDNHLRPQTEFLGPRVNRFYFEDGLLRVAEGLTKVLELETIAGLGHEYRTTESDVQTRWTDDAIASTQHMYAEDFRTLKYDPMATPV